MTRWGAGRKEIYRDLLDLSQRRQIVHLDLTDLPPRPQVPSSLYSVLYSDVHCAVAIHAAITRHHDASGLPCSGRRP